MKTLFRRSQTVIAATERADGDFHLLMTDPVVLERRQRAVNRRRWVMVDQVHGVAVHSIGPTSGAEAATEARAARADVIVARRPDTAVAIWAADCAPLVMLGDRGSVVAVHAGWRGLAAGIVDEALARLERSGEQVEAAVLGPVVHPCCYAFGATELALVAAGVGVEAAVIADAAADGSPALDVPAAVGAALRRHGVALDVIGPCTGCDLRWFSHRRGDRERHAVVVWGEATDDR